jgi:hypothetical protein
MDINNTQGNQNIRAQERYREAMVELVRRTRGRVQAAREQAANTVSERTARQEIDVRPASERGDRVDISNAMQERVQAAGLGSAAEDSNAKVERLREAHRNGTLNTAERIDRAARNLLLDPAVSVPDVATAPNVLDEA